MNVSAETRDYKKLHKIIAGLVVAATLPLVLWIVTVLLTVNVDRMWLIPSILMLLVLAAAVVVSFPVAAKGYKKTWKTEDYELYAKDGRLCYNGQNMHVNYNPKSDVIYVHDMGDAGDPSKANVYLTVSGDDKDRLMSYVCDNGIEIEEESSPVGRGRHAAVTNMNLSVSKYRRR